MKFGEIFGDRGVTIAFRPFETTSGMLTGTAFYMNFRKIFTFSAVQKDFSCTKNYMRRLNFYNFRRL